MNYRSRAIHTGLKVCSKDHYITGWTGKIGHPIVQRLEGRGVPARIAVDNVDHVRTIAAMVAALLFAIGLMQKDGN